MDFLQGLQITESSPLMSIADVHKAGQSFLEEDKNDTTEDKDKVDVTKKVEENNNGLLPITDLVESDIKEDKAKIEKKKSDSEFITLLKEFKERTGELEDFEDEDFKVETKEEFLELLENILYTNAENKANEYIKENLPGEYQKFVELTDAGVNEKDAADIIKVLKSIGGVTSEKLDESEDLSKQTYTQYLKLTSSWNDAKIKKEVERLTELGTITEEAKESLPELLQIISNREAYFKQEAKKREDEEKANQQTQIQQLKDYLENTDEIAGIKLNKKMKENWMKQYTPIKSSNGQVTTSLALKQSYNPQEFGALINFYDSIGLFKYDGRTKKYIPDFSVLKSLGTKEAVTQLSNAISNEKLKSQGKNGYGAEQDEIKSDEMIKRFEQIQDLWTKQKNANNTY